MIKPTSFEVSKLDKETHRLSELYSATRIKVGMKLAERLYEIDRDRLYLKLDEKAYPNFEAYVSSLGMSYHSIRALISIYQCFVLAGGYSIDLLMTIPYHKLSVIKPELFKRENGEYVMTKSKAEADKWIADAKSDLTVKDLKQKRQENKMGDHKHEFIDINYKQCAHCKLKVKYV